MGEQELIEKTRAYIDSGSIDSAEACVNRLLIEGTEDPYIYTDFAALLHKKGKLQKAELVYKKAISLKKDNIIALSNLSSLLRQLGKIEEAEKYVMLAIAINPNHANSFSNLANILRAKGKLDEAEIYYKKAIKLNPKHCNAFLNLGILLKERGRLDEARENMSRSIQICPDLEEGYVNLTLLLKEMRNHKETKEVINNFLVIKNICSNSYKKIAEVCMEIGEFEISSKCAKQSILTDPTNSENYITLGSIMRIKCINTSAIRSLVKGLELNKMHDSGKLILMSCLNEIEPEINIKNPIIAANNEIQKIDIKDTEAITVKRIKAIYSEALRAMIKHKITTKSSFSQIYRINNSQEMDCLRHMDIFNLYNIIPENCFSCYKVQVEPKNVIDLIKLYFIFNTLELDNDNTRKCMVEKRIGVSGYYKGIIYSKSFDDAKNINEKLNSIIRLKIDNKIESKIKRGCSEYAMKYPDYKYVSLNGEKKMSYRKEWKVIEDIYDNNKIKIRHEKRPESLKVFSLFDFLIIRNWIGYAQEIGDKASARITDEDLKSLKAPKAIDLGEYVDNNI